MTRTEQKRVMIDKDLKRKLKILYTAQDKHPPSRVDVSVLFQEKIVSRGHEIDWVLQSEETIAASKKVKWGRCMVYLGKTDNGPSFVNRLRKNIYRIINEFRLFQIAKKNRYDCIIVKDLFFAALIAIVASKVLRVKMVYWLSYPFPESDLYNFKKGTARYPLIYLLRGQINRFFLYQIILPTCNHIFVQSEQMKTDISKQGILKQKMTSVPMGVSAKKIPFYGYEGKGKNHAREKIILHLGTLIKARRLDFIIHVFNQVLTIEKSVKLYFVGGGEDASDEEILKDEVKRLKIEDSVVFTGNLPQEEAWKYVQMADVCLSPYYPTPILNSTSPTKIIEYMAMGKAVVANDHPEQSLILSESKAGICVPYDESAFVDAILYLLNHMEEAREMGIRGRKYVEQYRDYENIADMVETKLLQV